MSATFQRVYTFKLVMNDGSLPTKNDLIRAAQRLFGIVVHAYQARGDGKYVTDEATGQIQLTVDFDYREMALQGIYDGNDYESIERSMRPFPEMEGENGRKGTLNNVGPQSLTGKLEFVPPENMATAKFIYTVYNQNNQPVKIWPSSDASSIVKYIRNALIGHVQVEIPGFKDAFVGAWAPPKVYSMALFFSKLKMDPVAAEPLLRNAAESLRIAFNEPWKGENPDETVYSARVRLESASVPPQPK